MQDVYKTAEDIKAAGGKVTREPGPLPGLKTKIMSTVDPDGYIHFQLLSHMYSHSVQNSAICPGISRS